MTDIVEKMIKHEGNRWVVYSQDGTKKLGDYGTEAEAQTRLAQIEHFKQVGKADTEVLDNFVEIVGKAIRMLVPIEKAAGQAPRRITLGVVLEPDTEDLQGDIMSADDIEKSAHGWMEQSQAGGEMHSTILDGAKVVESYLAPCDYTVDTPAGPEVVRKGSWLLAMRWPEEQWQKITKGEYTGYSVGGQGVRVPIEEGANDG